jgi:hypothetical protein
MRTWRALLAALLTVALGACAPPPQSSPTSSAGPAASAAPTEGVSASVPVAAPATVNVKVTESKYGSVAVKTDAGAECSVEVAVAYGAVGQNPVPTLAAQVAPVTGVLRWTYGSPRIPQSRGEHRVRCNLPGVKSDTAIAIFDTYRAPMTATALTVHVTTDLAPDVRLNPDPSLVPLRDAAVAKMKSTLAAEWKAATRGLGSLQVVDDSADITVFVYAARGTSVNRLGHDGSEDILIYASDKFGPETVENLIATTLHELGHIWCCRGEGAKEGGHWQENLRDPGLYGVDKYGLMTEPVTCVTFGAIVSCPNRFSDREMRALGFTSFPPVTPDPCVTQGLSLSAKVASFDASLTTIKNQIDANRGRSAGLLDQLRALEAQYPYGLPPVQFAQYETLRAQYNSLIDANNRLIDQYNATLDQAKAMDAQMRSLPCDWT